MSSSTKSTVTIRPAQVGDSPHICRIVNQWADEARMLWRWESEVAHSIRDFRVAEIAGKVVACGALLIYDANLAEIRSLAVDQSAHGMGLGKRLVEDLAAEGKRLGLTKVFVFTLVPEFFVKLGFKQVTPDTLPQKVWKDCVNCPKKDACDEIAMMIEVNP